MCKLTKVNLCVPALIAAFLASLSGTALASPTCVVEVDGQRYVDGSCDSRRASDGSIAIRKRDGLTNSYYGHIMTDDSNHGHGYWSGKGGDRLESLGRMTREGSCWKNARARICAWE